MKRFIIETDDDVTEEDFNRAVYIDELTDASYQISEVRETWATADNRPRMTTKQRDALWELCGRYNKPFRESDYVLHERPSAFSPGVGWVEGWIGGPMFNGHNNQGKTIYVGISPEGEVHS